jgi:hypothetical protein
MKRIYAAIWIALPLLAAYIAHKKQRSWVGALALTIMAPPIGILVVLLVSPSNRTGQPTLATSKTLLFGLLPLWAAIAVVIVGSFTTSSYEYWAVAPWLIVAAIPACIVTLPLAQWMLGIAESRRQMAKQNLAVAQELVISALQAFQEGSNSYKSCPACKAKITLVPLRAENQTTVKVSCRCGICNGRFSVKENAG